MGLVLIKQGQASKIFVHFMHDIMTEPLDEILYPLVIVIA